MNILIISQYFWPESFRINDLAEGLAERGHQVTVLTGKPNYPGGEYYKGYGFLKKNHDTYRSMNIVRAPLVPRGKNSNLGLAMNYLSFAFFASMVGVLKCKRPDVIFVYEPSPITVGLPAIFFKKIKKVPIIFWVQDLWPESVIAVNGIRSKKILKCLEKLVRFIYSHCDTILTTSRSFFDPIKRFNVSEDKLRYFPQTAELLYQPMDPALCEAEGKLMPQGFRILFSGNIGVSQDIETIIQSAILLKQHKEIKWIFLGDGSKRSWLQDAIIRNALTDTVYWLGHHPVESIPRFFACADAFLVTVKKDPAFSCTVPAKIQSYLACAKPIVGALDGEGRSIIEESKAGVVTQSSDPASLAQIAMDLHSLKPDVRMQMGLNGKKYFDEHFQRDMLLGKLEHWMLELKERK